METASVKDLYEALKHMDKAGLITDAKVTIFLVDDENEETEYQIAEMSHFSIEPNLILRIVIADD